MPRRRIASGESVTFKMIAKLMAHPMPQRRAEPGFWPVNDTARQMHFHCPLKQPFPNRATLVCIPSAIQPRMPSGCRDLERGTLTSTPADIGHFVSVVQIVVPGKKEFLLQIEHGELIRRRPRGNFLQSAVEWFEWVTVRQRLSHRLGKESVQTFGASQEKYPTMRVSGCSPRILKCPSQAAVHSEMSVRQLGASLLQIMSHRLIQQAQWRSN